MKEKGTSERSISLANGVVFSAVVVRAYVFCCTGVVSTCKNILELGCTVFYCKLLSELRI